MTAPEGIVVPRVKACTWPSFICSTASVYDTKLTLTSL